MKKTLLAITVIASLVFQVGIASALTSGEAKQDWLTAKQARIDADIAYRQAQLDYATDNTPENDQKVIDSAKALLSAALDEAEAWLNWKKLEAEGNDEVPKEIKTKIKSDVTKNLDKIAGLRQDVDGIETRLDAAMVFLKMVGAYVELLVDVARNTGSMWVYLGEKRVETAGNYEEQLRAAAEELEDNSEIIAKLDIAKTEISTAEKKVETAKTAYQKVFLPGTPLIKFGEGNEYLRQARTNLINAHLQMEHAFNLIISKK